MKKRKTKKNALDLEKVEKEVKANYKESEVMTQIRHLILKLDADVRKRLEGTA